MSHFQKVLIMLDWPGARAQAMQDRSSGLDLANPWAAPTPTQPPEALTWQLTLGAGVLFVVGLGVGAVAHYLHPGRRDGQDELFGAAAALMMLTSGFLQALRAGGITRPGWWQRPKVATILKWTSVLASIVVVVLAVAEISYAFWSGSSS